MSVIIAELRLAFRSLRLQPLFTLAAISTLALGIAAITAVFSAVNAVYLKALPYPDAERLVQVWMDDRGVDRHWTVSPSELHEFAQARSFAQVAAFNIAFFTINTGQQGARRVSAAVVTPNFLRVLGVRPALGAGFTAAHGQPGQNRVAMVSDGYWRTQMAGNSAVVGQSVRLNGEPHEIVGVLPAGYRHPEPGWDEDAQVLVPIAFSETERVGTGRYLRVLARLQPGVSLGVAQAELDGAAARLARRQPLHNSNWGVNVVSLRDEFFGRARGAIKMLLLAGFMVLAVVCVNVANLFLVRDQRRRRDLALRSALGANRKRLAAPVVLESLIVALAGAALGSALVKAGERALGTFASSNLSKLADFTLDQRVTWFVIGVAMLCCLLVGGMPALRSARTDLRRVLAELSRGVSAGPGARRSRAVPIVLQVALTTVLLVCTLLLGRSVLALLHTPTGFHTQDVITLELEAPAWRYPKAEDAVRFHEEVVTALSALPGVSSVGLVSDLPFTGWNTFVDLRTASAETRYQTEYQVVSADYFRTIGIAHREGRTFQNSDGAHTRLVAVVNQQLARVLAPNGSVLGQHLRVGNSDTLVVEVVGVVGDILDDSFRAATETRLYLPLQQRPRRWLSAVVQTRSDARPLMTAVRTRLQQLDAEVPVWNVRTLQSMVSDSVKRERAAFLLLAVFTCLTLALAGVGIYGVIAYTVSDRRREIGIRAALGAEPARLAGTVLREATLTVVLGIMIGGWLAFFATRALQSLLFGVGRFDPLSLAAAVTLLLGIALCAAWLPARRAARVPPWETLRTD